MDNSKLKKFASHTVAVVVGLFLATQCQGPKTSIVEKEVIKEVKVEVPVEKIVEKVVEKIKYVKVPRKCPKAINQDEVTELIEYHVSIQHENRLSLLGGVGPNGLNKKTTSTGYMVEANTGPLFGLGLSHRVHKQYSIGVQVLNNASVLGELGVDF
jgi:hypothetical protein